ncbi:MAG: DUF6884 domain-containing protein [Candidatus Hodarchaeota archaeon]
MEQKKILLIISCGKKKASELHNIKLPALKGYKGPMFQVIAKAKREGRWSSNIYLGIISAEYGFLRSTDEIEYYDKRMTAELSKQLNAQVIKAIKRWHMEENFNLIYVLMGTDYIKAVDGLKKHLNAEIIIENMGGLGIGQKKLKNFLDHYSRLNNSQE